MVDIVIKSMLSDGMKWILALVVGCTAYLGISGVLEGELVSGIFMGVLLLAQNMLRGGKDA